MARRGPDRRSTYAVGNEGGTSLAWDEAGVAQVTEQMHDAAEAVAEAMAQRARDNSPVLTGDYRDSIRVRRTPTRTRVIVDVPYALAVEYGTADTPAFAPLTRAQDEVAPQIPAIVASKVR